MSEGALDGLGAVVLGDKAWDIDRAARDMLRRVDYYRRMSPAERNALGPLAMRRQLAADLALLCDALQGAGLLRPVASGESFRAPVRAKPPGLRPKRRR